ncbi:hypothetical protein P8452_33683 [Trifolium repens]|nr:hypothetical protein P8452_33683 [Trifolium repens]
MFHRVRSCTFSTEIYWWRKLLVQLPRHQNCRHQGFVNFVANSLVSSSVSEEEKEQEVAMSLIMLSRDVRPWCGINSIAEFSDNNNHNDNDDNSLELEYALTHLVSKIEVKKRVISNGFEFVKVTKKPKKLDFSNIVSSKGKSLEIFADD